MKTFGVYARKSNDQRDVSEEAKSVTIQIRRAREFGEAREHLPGHTLL